jgi:hypothetical protein
MYQVGHCLSLYQDGGQQNIKNYMFKSLLQLSSGYIHKITDKIQQSVNDK